MVAIPFPNSSVPGQRPGEGRGRLVNWYVENAGDKTLIWRPSPGLSAFASAPAGGQRGFIDVGGTLYGAYLDKAYTMTAGGVATILTGNLFGSRQITWARNNKPITPDVIAVDYDNGAYKVSSTAVTLYGDADLPQPNSVSFLDGYTLFTIADGRLFGSGLNDELIDALSFASLEAKPDGLLRGIVAGQLFYGYGPDSCEVWQNVGTTPFPLNRVAVIPVGLIGPFAIAGFGTGWDLPHMFVAQDGTVRQMKGYDPIAVSRPDVERAIQNVADKTTLKASVHVVAGHANWVLSSDDWTWIYDVSTDEWHERTSYGLVRWRGDQAVKFDDKWLVGDTESAVLHEITEATYREGENVYRKTLESADVEKFPARLEAMSAFFNFTVGQGSEIGADPVETDPQVAISYSKDGGANWSNPVLRSLGREGEFNRVIRINRLGQGRKIRFRVDISDPVAVSFKGAAVEARAF